MQPGPLTINSDNNTNPFGQDYDDAQSKWLNSESVFATPPPPPPPSIQKRLSHHPEINLPPDEHLDLPDYEEYDARGAAIAATLFSTAAISHIPVTLESRQCDEDDLPDYEEDNAEEAAVAAALKAVTLEEYDPIQGAEYNDVETQQNDPYRDDDIDIDAEDHQNSEPETEFDREFNKEYDRVISMEVSDDDYDLDDESIPVDQEYYGYDYDDDVAQVPGSSMDEMNYSHGKNGCDKDIDKEFTTADHDCYTDDDDVFPVTPMLESSIMEVSDDDYDLAEEGFVPADYIGHHHHCYANGDYDLYDDDSSMLGEAFFAVANAPHDCGCPACIVRA
ncbi:hypothetical protein BG011_006664 [Mortierella polycephala]|uniref:Uncharacterized protein n=1 Tax=Mortierella polycephala TaxID=41804 RepID=A0A9P6QAV0_9FUNG|nr:hypothetical protein BG011_006664 [Mortierella polycephala]